MNFSWWRKGICRSQYRLLYYWLSGLWCCLSFREGLCVSSCLVLWLWRQRVALMKESFVGFFLWMWFAARSWTLVDERKEFAGHSIGYCFTGLVACDLVLVFVFLCVIYTVIVDQRIILKFWRVDIYWPIRFVSYYFIFEPKYFMLVHFRSYFFRMFYSMFFSWLVEKYKNVI